MPVPTQVLILCLSSALIGGLLGSVRGVPAAAAALDSAQGGACRAPDEGDPSEQAVGWITQEQARALLDEGTAQFVDCRPPELFHGGHVSGSLSLSEVDAMPEAAWSQLGRAPTVITYCDAAGGCDRSVRVATALKSRGLADVRVLEGGMPQWLNNGYPAESGSCGLCPHSN